MCKLLSCGAKYLDKTHQWFRSSLSYGRFNWPGGNEVTQTCIVNASSSFHCPLSLHGVRSVWPIYLASTGSFAYSTLLGRIREMACGWREGRRPCGMVAGVNQTGSCCVQCLQRSASHLSIFEAKWIRASRSVGTSSGAKWFFWVSEKSFRNTSINADWFQPLSAVMVQN